MSTEPRDLAQIRLENALALFDDFVQSTAAPGDPASLRGLDGRFAAQLLIQPSYWSQIKARSRQIGERLARQFEQRSKKPNGWLDQPHDTASRASAPSAPVDDDERFIVGLVLSYYRRHPERARERLLGLIGEALQAPSPDAAVPARRSEAQGDDALWTQVRARVAPLKRKR